MDEGRLVYALSRLTRAAAEASTEIDVVRESLHACKGEETENLAYVVRVLESALDDAMDVLKPPEGEK